MVAGQLGNTFVLIGWGKPVFEFIKILNKKIQPSKIIILTHPKKYHTEDIRYFDNEILANLPRIFGSQKNFLKIYSSLVDLDFPITDIKSFYYFEIGRWDIILKNSNTIKLPVTNFNESLKNYKDLKKDFNFEEYSIFDYRIKDQLILN